MLYSEISYYGPSGTHFWLGDKFEDVTEVFDAVEDATDAVDLADKLSDVRVKGSLTSFEAVRDTAVTARIKITTRLGLSDQPYVTYLEVKRK